MAKSKDNPDTLTEAQQAERDRGDVAPAAEPVEVSKGELTDTVLHAGKEFPRGTKASSIKPKLSEDDRERLTDLGLIAGASDADE